MKFRIASNMQYHKLAIVQVNNEHETLNGLVAIRAHRREKKIE